MFQRAKERLGGYLPLDGSETMRIMTMMRTTRMMRITMTIVIQKDLKTRQIDLCSNRRMIGPGPVKMTLSMDPAQGSNV